MAILINQTATVKWSNNNKKYYINLGYSDFCQNKEFEVRLKHLPSSSRALIKASCDHCNKEYNTKFVNIGNIKNNFCTRLCQNSFLKGKPSWNSNKIEITCFSCKKKIIRSAGELERQKHFFCSKSCVDTYRKGKPNSKLKVKRIKTECSNCATSIERTEKEFLRHKRHFCGKSCSDSFNKGKTKPLIRQGEYVSCNYCSNSFYLPKYRIESQQNYFCNNSCRINWMKSESFKEFSRKENPDSFITKSCSICSEPITRKHWNFKGENPICNSDYCKKELSKLYNPKKEKVKVNCNQCGEMFKVHKSKMVKNKWVFCSRNCYKNYRSENLRGENSNSYQNLFRECDNCGTSVKVVESTINNKNIFCKQKCYYEYRSKYYIGEKHPQFGTKKTEEQIDKMRQITTERIASGSFPQTDTKIHIKTRELLQQINGTFDEEIPFKYYVLDFYSKELNLGIEVMGDYWHANPKKFTIYDQLHDIQKKDIRRDKSKMSYLKKYHDIDILYLWEMDINKFPEKCLRLIDEFTRKKSLMNNQSYNYDYDNKKLKLKEEIISPYFLRANTQFQKCHEGFKEDK